MKSTTKNILLFLGGITSLIVAYLTMLGTIQQYINFEDPINEMLFCVMAITLGALCIFTSIPQRHYNGKS